MKTPKSWGWLWSCFVIAGLFAGCGLLAPGNPIGAVETSIGSPSVVPTSTFVLTSAPTFTQTTKNAYQITYYAKEDDQRYGIYAVDVGCLDTDHPCLSRPRLLFRPSNLVLSMSWSPDGQRVVFEMVGSGDTKRDIYMAEWDGSHLENLTNSPYDEYSPVWAWDGTKIVYLQHEYKTGTKVFSMDLQSNGVTQISIHTNIKAPIQIALAHDGKKMAFSENDLNGIYQIAITHLDNSNFLLVTEDGRGKYQPDFSPDGQWIAYVQDGNTIDDEMSLWISRSDRISTTMLPTKELHNILTPKWSPTSAWIALVGETLIKSRWYEISGEREYKADVFLITSDGRKLINVTGDQEMRPSLGLAWRSTAGP